jgi:hypothetical protein
LCELDELGFLLVGEILGGQKRLLRFRLIFLIVDVVALKLLVVVTATAMTTA